MTPKRFKRGEHVSWNSEAGRVRGKITRVVTAPTEFKGYTVHASRDEPDQERDHGPSRDAQGRGAHEAPRRSPSALTHLVCVPNRNGVPSNGRGHYQECKAMNILDHLVGVSGDSRSGEFKRETSSPYGMGPPGRWDLGEGSGSARAIQVWEQECGKRPVEPGKREAAEPVTAGRLSLLTNNPKKIVALERYGIRVTERIPHVIPANAYNRVYLQTKAARSGHFIDVDGKPHIAEQDDPVVIVNE